MRVQRMFRLPDGFVPPPSGQFIQSENVMQFHLEGYRPGDPEIAEPAIAQDPASAMRPDYRTRSTC